MEDDSSDTQRVLKTLENHAMRIKHERDIKVAKVPVTKAVYDANKAINSEESNRLQLEINVLKGDIKFCKADTDEIIVRPKNILAQNLNSILDLTRRSSPKLGQIP